MGFSQLTETPHTRSVDTTGKRKIIHWLCVSHSPSTVWAVPIPLYGIGLPFCISAGKSPHASARKEGFIGMKKIAVIMGSDSDLPVVEKAIRTLQEYEVPAEVHVYSAHRTPTEARDFAVSARANGFGAIICAAGMAAHLAGAFAANTTLPVIGIPVKSANFDGLDALLSTVQMPTGLPVATVAVDGAANAALLAIQMLAIEDASLAAKLDAARIAGAEKVLAKDAAVAAKYNA